MTRVKNQIGLNPELAAEAKAIVALASAMGLSKTYTPENLVRHAAAMRAIHEFRTRK